MIELDNIYNMDCLEGMKMIPDGAVDAIICDLPYEVLHKNNPNAQWDRMIPMEPLWEQYKRVIKDNGAILLFCQGMFTAQLMMSQPKLWRYNLVWDKCRTTGFLNANRMPLRRHEDIAVFYKSLPVYHPQMKRGEPNHPRGIHNSTNNCYGKYKTDKVYDYDKKSVKKVEPTRPGEKFPTSIISIEKLNATKVEHPTQKPVELIRYLIRTYSETGGGNSRQLHGQWHDGYSGHEGKAPLYRLRAEQGILRHCLQTHQRRTTAADAMVSALMSARQKGKVVI